MRTDMYRVVIERPRFGHANRSRKWGGRVDELYEGPTFISSARRRQYGWYSKELSDLINPLIRYLHKQVGRPWDKVYSEIKRALPKGLHADHIWSHVKSEVQIHCYEQDGKIWYVPAYLGRYPTEVNGLYVHPRTGLLRLKSRPSSHGLQDESKNVLRRIVVGEAAEYRHINGIWYYVEFSDPDPLAPAGSRRVMVKKKQLNRKELQVLRAEYPRAA